MTVGPAFVPDDGVASKGTVTRSGQVLTWVLPDIGDETVTLTYPVTHVVGAPCGTQQVNDSVTYSDAEGATVAVDPLTVDVAGCPRTVELSGPGPVDAVAGTSAPVVATVLDDLGLPVGGRQVDLTVVSGPNAGHTASGTTGADGQAALSIPSGGVAGVDVVEATTSALDGATLTSAALEVRWLDVTPPQVPVPDDMTVEATGPTGAPATFSSRRRTRPTARSRPIARPPVAPCFRSAPPR